MPCCNDLALVSIKSWKGALHDGSPVGENERLGGRCRPLVEGTFRRRKSQELGEGVK